MEWPDGLHTCLLLVHGNLKSLIELATFHVSLWVWGLGGGTASGRAFHVKNY